MTYPTVFANLAAGNEPLSLFDTMFNVVGQQGNLPCTATGTNAITLTPNTNYYLPAAYTNAQIASFKAVATSSGAMTIQIGGLALIKLFTAAGVQANSGDVVNASHYAIQYWSDLDSGNGAFIILNATVTAIANPLQGSFKNLKLTVASNTALTPTADALILQNGSGGTVRVTAFAPGNTSTATTGANALDSGSVATSTSYFWYAIYNANTSTAAGLLSTSSTSPALPSGYTYYARYGAVFTDGSANLMRTLQLGRKVQYVVGSNPSLPPNIANSSGGAVGSGSLASPTLATASITGFVPSTASRISIIATSNYNNTVSGHATNVLVAPNTAWGGTNRGPTGSTNVGWPLFIAGSVVNYNAICELELEATTVAWWADNTAGAISCLGWEDNI